MRRYENDCCDCAVPAYPCLGSLCPLRSVLHIYCDVCECEADKIYTCNGDEVCEECLIEYLIDNEIIEEIQE
jgi:hypothetical protein